MRDDRLSEKHVVITGAAQGIGRGIAIRAAEAGASLTLFDKKVDEVEETRELIQEVGTPVQIFNVDVSNRSEVLKGVNNAVENFGPIHGLVNNAGIQEAIPLLETVNDDFEDHFDVNVKGVFHCAKFVVQQMIDENIEGSIVNIASISAVKPYRSQGAYAASKAAVDALTTVMSKEWGQHGITANSINPGTVETPMVEEWLEQNAAQLNVTEEEFLEDVRGQHTIGRIGQPHEIGNVVVLLLSDEGDWMTGEAITIDGGFTNE